MKTFISPLNKIYSLLSTLLLEAEKQEHLKNKAKHFTHHSNH